MTGLDIGLPMFGAMLVLMAIRVPIAIAMFVPGAAGYLLLTGDNALLSHLKGVAYRPVLGVRPVGDPDVPADGPVRDPRRPVAFAVRGRERADRTLSRRPRDGRGARLRGFRRDLRLVGRHRGDHGPGRAAGDATLVLFRSLATAHARRRRHAGHPDSAVGRARRLRDPHRAEHRQAVRSGVRAGDHRRGASTCIAIAIYVRRHPKAGPAQPRHCDARDRRDRCGTCGRWLRSSSSVFGGIYGGIFTPTEGAAIGATLTFVLGIVKRELDRGGGPGVVCRHGGDHRHDLHDCSRRRHAQLFLALSQMPAQLATRWPGWASHRCAIVGAILLMYIVLGA